MSAFLRKAIRARGLPEKVTIDQSGSNTAAIIRYNRIHKAAIIMQQAKYTARGGELRFRDAWEVMW